MLRYDKRQFNFEGLHVDQTYVDMYINILREFHPVYNKNFIIRFLNKLHGRFISKELQKYNNEIPQYIKFIKNLMTILPIE